MNRHLFFISIIEQALKGQDTVKALENAFQEIKKRGFQKPYTEGFRNFERFMDIAFMYREVFVTDYIRRFIVELAANVFDGTEWERQLLLETIYSHPEWKAEYETICHEQATEDLEQNFPLIQLICGEQCIGERELKKIPERVFFEGISPGNYKIKLVNTGWIIWEGKLTSNELIWTALPMAAETERIQKRRTNKIDLLNNEELILHTYPGIEKGRIEIELTR